MANYGDPSRMFFCMVSGQVQAGGRGIWMQDQRKSGCPSGLLFGLAQVWPSKRMKRIHWYTTPRHSKTFQDYPECLTWLFLEGSVWLFPNIAMVFHLEITSSNPDAEAWFVVEQPSYGTCTDRYGGIWIWTSDAQVLRITVLRQSTTAYRVSQSFARVGNHDSFGGSLIVLVN